MWNNEEHINEYIEEYTEEYTGFGRFIQVTAAESGVLLGRLWIGPVMIKAEGNKPAPVDTIAPFGRKQDGATAHRCTDAPKPTFPFLR